MTDELQNTEQIDSKVAELQDRCSQLEDQVRRSMADYQNLLRRTQKEREELLMYSAEPTIRAILPSLDNFYFALKSFTDVAESDQVASSLKMIWNGMIQSLEAIGFKLINPQGETFDPVSHEAVAKVPGNNSPEGTIVEVFRPGYALRDRVLKPAQVVVSSGEAVAS